MSLKLTVLYRGPLESCNYACWYCPFAKRQESAVDHERDAAALERFSQWIAAQTDLRLSIFFTPWGEALIRRRYQRTIAWLSTLEHVEKVAIQTNLSARLDWAEQACKPKIGLWATYHPGQVDRERFVAKCYEAVARSMPISVGVVGLREHETEIAALRAALPTSIYVWINAYKREPNYYSDELLVHFSTIDPLFPYNNQRHPSYGQRCRTGNSVIAVAGDGTIKRCHFIPQPLGNIYDPAWRNVLQERPCTNTSCGCHIGYVHLERLGLDHIFGTGILERIPSQPIWLKSQAAVDIVTDQQSPPARQLPGDTSA